LWRPPWRCAAATPDAPHLSKNPKELNTMVAENIAVTEHLALCPWRAATPRPCREAHHGKSAW